MNFRNEEEEKGQRKEGEEGKDEVGEGKERIERRKVSRGVREFVFPHSENY